MSFRVALALAEKLGCDVYKNNQGEMVVKHPLFGRAYRVHTGRKDTPQNLVSALRQLTKKLSEA